MPEALTASPNTVADVYNEPAMEWILRTAGYHLHPRGEEATVALADRAAHYRFPTGGLVLEIASALGAPARYVSRRFGASVLCIDMDPRMHAAGRAAARAEGLALVCQQVLGRAERLPLATASCDAAWSQDAICHMDAAAVVAEVARVLKPGAIFAFTDWVATSLTTDGDRKTLRELWAFPNMPALSEYVAILDRSGFEVLLGEDRTAWAVGHGPRVPAADQEIWLTGYTARWGDDEVVRRTAPGEAWSEIVTGGRGGYAMFIARRL